MRPDPKLTYLRPFLAIIWFISVAFKDQLDSTFPAFAPIRAFSVAYLPVLYIILLIRSHRIKHGKPLMPP